MTPHTVSTVNRQRLARRKPSFQERRFHLSTTARATRAPTALWGSFDLDFDEGVISSISLQASPALRLGCVLGWWVGGSCSNRTAVLAFACGSFSAFC